MARSSPIGGTKHPNWWSPRTARSARRPLVELQPEHVREWSVEREPRPRAHGRRLYRRIHAFGYARRCVEPDAHRRSSGASPASAQGSPWAIDVDIEQMTLVLR